MTIAEAISMLSPLDYLALMSFAMLAVLGIGSVAINLFLGRQSDK